MIMHQKKRSMMQTQSCGLTGRAVLPLQARVQLSAVVPRPVGWGSKLWKLVCLGCGFSSVHSVHPRPITPQQCRVMAATEVAETETKGLAISAS